MNQEQLEFIWQLAEVDGSVYELSVLFPDVNWEEVDQVLQAKRDAEWALRPHHEQAAAMAQVNEILKDTWENYISDQLNYKSPLVEFLKK